MTALTQPPGRLLSIADYAALSEDDRNRWELQEGDTLVKRGEYADAGGRRALPE